MRQLAGDAVRRLRGNPAAVLALFVMSGVIVVTLFGPWVNPNNAQALDWLHLADILRQLHEALEKRYRHPQTDGQQLDHHALGNMRRG